MFEKAVNLRNKWFWRRLQTLVGPGVSVAIDLGAGTSPKNDFQAEEVWSLDIVTSDQARHITCDASLGNLPIGDNRFDLVTAYDFLEHIPRVTMADGRTRFPFIDLMNEIFRIMKPGAYFFSYTPVFPKKSAFQDPTHVNIMTRDTLSAYFCGPEPIARIYGFTGSFEMKASGWKGSHFFALIQKLDE